MRLETMRMVAVVTLLVCGCVSIARSSRSPVERLDERGVSAPSLTLEVGSVLQFVNADSHPHQIYSNDCNELSSTVLQPGETYNAMLLASAASYATSRTCSRRSPPATQARSGSTTRRRNGVWRRRMRAARE